MTSEKTSAVKEAFKEVSSLYREALKNFLLKEELTEEDLKELKSTVMEVRKVLSKTLRYTTAYLEEIARKTDDKELRALVRSLKDESLSDFLDRLEYETRRLNKEEIREKLDRVRFRIMELARVGRFDEVLYTIERVLFSSGEVPPKSLLELLSDPLNPDEVKKNAVYLFLAVIKPLKKEEGNE